MNAPDRPLRNVDAIRLMCGAVVDEMLLSGKLAQVCYGCGKISRISIILNGKAHCAKCRAHWIDEEIAAASVDTLPKGQDAQQGLAGTESGAVGEAETPGKGRP